MARFARNPGSFDFAQCRLHPGLHLILCDLSRSDAIPTTMKVNIAEKFSKVTELWKPYVVAELNGQMVKLDKIKGEFVFHHHDNEDEMFLVVKGRFRMEFRDRPNEWIEEGEFIVVPRGVEHKPIAEEECWFLLFEPAGTLNTGNVVNERTHQVLEHV
ncbi:MAG TPA: cupin domain-containing protein [Candidatus Sulfotelmatobacter sp.]|nr:cupin domain-containing protein [Candidatus Sulfotelmatobacter sp.]